MEFIALLESSGWNQVEAAKRLHKTQAVISRWKNNIDPADRATVELFKLLLSVEKPSAIAPAALHDAPLSGDIDIWRNRAKRAEQELADLRQGLRILLDGPNSKIQQIADTIQAQLEDKAHTERTVPKPLPES